MFVQLNHRSLTEAVRDMPGVQFVAFLEALLTNWSMLMRHQAARFWLEVREDK